MNNTIYDGINQNASRILREIPASHVKDYDWLIENIQYLRDPDYQKRYKIFWRLHGAGLSQDFCSTYFQYLENALQNPLPLKTLVTELYQVPCTPNRKAIQFSFCTKLCHMMNRNLPIYDSKIKTFYKFTPPSTKMSTERRINEFLGFYENLKAEYRRILTDRLLQQSIEAFRISFQPKHFTDAKIIDSLLWGSAPKKTETAFSPRHKC